MPELEGLLLLLKAQFQNIGTTFHSIQFALHSKDEKTMGTLSQELEFCFSMLLPCLQTMLMLVRIRRDFFDKYTPIFNPLVCMSE